LGLSLIACGGQHTGPVGNTALGIAQFEQTETQTKLHVVGLDAKGVAVAEVTVQLGRFQLVDEDRMVDGRQIEVRFGERSSHHVSEGYLQLRLPQLRSREANAFLADPHVGPVLERWGVGFASAPAGNATESPEYGCGHSWPVSVNQCEGYQSDGYEEACSSGAPGTVYNRSCTSACYSGCGGQQYWTDCGWAGQYGCAGCWTDSFYSTCHVWRCSGDQVFYSVDTSCYGLCPPEYCP
jgi:hypothetical protein